MSKESNQISQPALEAFKPFETFCKAMLDGFVVVDDTGKILKANPLIAQVCGLSTKQILSLSSFDKLLSMKVGEEAISIQDILRNELPTRIDEVSASGSNGKELHLMLGYFPLKKGDAIVGGWLLVRDITAEAQLQGKYKDKAEKSITDPMTGLFNRGHFEDYLKSQDEQLVRLPFDSDHRNLSVIMFDIDHFKKINDRLGHPAGDYVIKMVSLIIQKTFRKTDVLCRYGGEEFLVILPASNLEGSAIAGEKVRLAIEAFKFEFEGQQIPVSISGGVAQLNVGHELGKDAIARADSALYFSKQSGRNRISLHDGTVIEPSEYKPQAVAQMNHLPAAS